jgi:transposase
MKTESSELFIGVDISKDRLDIANDSNSEVWSEFNNDGGVSLLVEKLTPLKPCLVVMEATGGHETLLYLP